MASSFQPFKLLFILWSACCIFVLPYMSREAGITEDELAHNEHGKRILAWYEGKDQTAVKSPFDDKGVYNSTDLKVGMNIYGASFDLLDSLLYTKIFYRWLGEYEFRHILSALFGAAMLIFTGLIGYRLTGSWLAGLITLVMVSLTPRLFGNSLSNPKDIPMATFYAFSLLQIILFLKELPEVKFWRVAWLVLSLLLALSLKSGSIILVFYLFLFGSLQLLWMLYNREIDFKRSLRLFLYFIQVSVVAYLGACLLWPWALQNPFLNPLRSLLVFKNYDAFHSLALFEGQWLAGKHVPWYFVPQWLYITLPVVAIAGLVLFVVLLPGFLRSTIKSKMAYSLIVFSILFPLLSIIINHSNIYDSARHILFVVPPLIVLAAAGWAGLFERVQSTTLKITTGLVFLITLAEPATFIAQNNPVQAMYFSPLIGGARGAFMKYEMDYWGYSVKPAIDWLEKNDTTYISGRKAKVRLWYGEQLKLKYYTDKSKHLDYIRCNENSTDWDYSIMLPAEAKFNHDIIYHWPPQGTVHEVMMNGAPLCAIVKNYHTLAEATPPVAAAAPVQQQETINFKPSPTFKASMKYVSSGDAYHKAGDHNRSIIEFKKAIAEDPQNVFAYNNLAACYNELKMFDEAINNARKGLSISPDFQLLKNNLAAALQTKEQTGYSESYYFNNSYYYFMQHDYQKSIQCAQQCLKYNPNNAYAWNNICSAYNQLKDYNKALAASERAIQLDPGNQRIKNNREETLKALGRL